MKNEDGCSIVPCRIKPKVKFFHVLFCLACAADFLVALGEGRNGLGRFSKLAITMQVQQCAQARQSPMKAYRDWLAMRKAMAGVPTAVIKGHQRRFLWKQTKCQVICAYCITTLYDTFNSSYPDVLCGRLLGSLSLVGEIAHTQGSAWRHPACELKVISLCSIKKQLTVLAVTLFY